MFWNDPNLYSVAFKDVPNVPTPFGQVPRFFGGCAGAQHLFNQPMLPFTPYNPYLQTQTTNPFINPIVNTPVTPFAGINPYMHTPYLPQQPINPWVNPTMTTPYLPYNLYNYNLPFYGYRPFIY